MKKIFVAAIALMTFGSCIKSDTRCPYNESSVVAPASEVQALQDSLTAHGIQASSHPSGFFYTINQQGSGPSIANLCSMLSITYKGAFFNGKVFDSTAAGTVANFQLGGLIVGWQKGVPLISKGGDITLYIPPSLAYGSVPRADQNGNVVIPGNSYLVFNLHLVDVQ